MVSKPALDAYVLATESGLEYNFSSAKDQLAVNSVPTAQHHPRYQRAVCFLGEEGREDFLLLVSGLFPGGKKKKKRSRLKPVLNYTLSCCVEGEEETTEVE